MDIKTPSSGMCRGGFYDNLKFLKADDEIKFVLCSLEDYHWAKKIVQNGLPTREVLFSPAVKAMNQPGTFDGLSYEKLASLILEDRLPVRMQVQLHKIIWGMDKIGV